MTNFFSIFIFLKKTKKTKKFFLKNKKKIQEIPYLIIRLKMNKRHVF